MSIDHQHDMMLC